MLTQCRIIFLDGSYLDFTPPEGFNFQQWIKAIRGDGFILGDTLYARVDAIKCILVWDESNPPLVQQANAPSTGTKQ